jgi:hypothetical protein
MMRFAFLSGNRILNGFGCGINGGGWFGMMLIGLLLIGLIIYLVYRLPKKTGPGISAKRMKLKYP